MGAFANAPGFSSTAPQTATSSSTGSNALVANVDASAMSMALKIASPSQEQLKQQDVINAGPAMSQAGSMVRGLNTKVSRKQSD